MYASSLVEPDRCQANQPPWHSSRRWDSDPAARMSHATCPEAILSPWTIRHLEQSPSSAPSANQAPHSGQTAMAWFVFVNRFFSKRYEILRAIVWRQASLPASEGGILPPGTTRPEERPLTAKPTRSHKRPFRRLEARLTGRQDACRYLLNNRTRYRSSSSTSSGRLTVWAISSRSNSP